MRRLPLFILSLIYCGACLSAKADDAAQPLREGAVNWPREVVINVGDVRTRIAGEKMWTLSGVDHQGNLMATEDSAYGTVLTIRNVGHLGAAHFLDVPGKPDEIETEQVTDLRLFVDDKPVEEFETEMSLVGKSFLMERRSKIRALELETTIAIADSVLTETAHFRATGPLDLQVAYPWMYAWTSRAARYVFGDDEGILGRGEFLKEGKPVSKVIRNANWMAVFITEDGRGAVCRIQKPSPLGDSALLLVDAPGIYRKIAAYTLQDHVIANGFDETYEAKVGFFNATEDNWEERAISRARELKSE